MNFYLCGLRSDIPDHRLLSVVRGARSAQFVVKATDQQVARSLLVQNFGVATARAPDNKIYQNAWRDAEVSFAIEIAGPVPQQKRVVKDIDIAPWYIDVMETSDGLGGVARMVWWPCSPNEQCPAKLD